MKNEEFREHISGFMEEMNTLLTRKGKDYSEDDDRLSNFKNAPFGAFPTFGIYMHKHWCSIQNYLKRGQLESEPIEERLLDLANYCLLLHAYITEQKNGHTDSTNTNHPKGSSVRS